ALVRAAARLVQPYTAGRPAPLHGAAARRVRLDVHARGGPGGLRRRRRRGVPSPQRAEGEGRAGGAGPRRVDGGGRGLVRGLQGVGRGRCGQGRRGAGGGGGRGDTRPAEGVVMTPREKRVTFTRLLA